MESGKSEWLCPGSCGPQYSAHEDNTLLVKWHITVGAEQPNCL